MLCEIGRAEYHINPYRPTPPPLILATIEHGSRIYLVGCIVYTVPLCSCHTYDFVHYVDVVETEIDISSLKLLKAGDFLKQNNSTGHI